MVNEAIGVSFFCLCSAILAIILKRYCQEQSMLTSLAGCIIVISAFAAVVGPVVTEIYGIFSEAGIESDYAALIMKAAAICFITQITCEICKDSGENALASAIELWCRGALTVMALPMVKTILEAIKEYI